MSASMEQNTIEMRNICIDLKKLLRLLQSGTSTFGQELVDIGWGINKFFKQIFEFTFCIGFIMMFVSPCNNVVVLGQYLSVDPWQANGLKVLAQDFSCQDHHSHICIFKLKSWHHVRFWCLVKMSWSSFTNEVTILSRFYCTSNGSIYGVMFPYLVLI